MSPLRLADLVYAVIQCVADRADIVNVFLGVKLVRYHVLEAVRANASGRLRSANGRNDTVSRKPKYSIFMHIIFGPFRMKCMSNDLAL